jgi:hypothetical protein
MQTEVDAMRWTVREERVVDETRRIRLSIAKVELSDGHGFEQYVLRCAPAEMVLAVDDQDRVLLMWRHQFVIDRWCWSCQVDTCAPAKMSRPP